MISSKYIADILDLLLDGDEDGKFLRNQMAYIADNEYQYTGYGVFINFKTLPGIEAHRSSKDNLHLDGVSIKSPEIDNFAEAHLMIRDGFISYLEISCVGKYYPNKDPNEYVLKQEWEGSSHREIIHKS